MAHSNYFPPPPPIPPKTRMFQRTPPAIFPPILGAFGLGLAWRRAADGFGIPLAVAEMILGAVTLLYLFCVMAYVAKLIQRSDTYIEDLKVLPGRAGLAALVLCGYLLASTLVPHSIVLAGAVLIAAFGLHAVVAVRVIIILVTGPVEARTVTPVWHLLFVGFILSPLAAVPMGLSGYSTGVFWGTFGVALAIWGASLAQFLKAKVPAPLRPLLAIHLAPASVLGTVAFLLGYTQLAMGLTVLAMVIFTVLVASVRWLLEAGFSPLWGALTFPLAAFSTLLQIAAVVSGSEVLRVVAGLSLVTASLIIPPIVYKIMQMWMKGVLAAKTNAAQA